MQSMFYIYKRYDDKQVRHFEELKNKNVLRAFWSVNVLHLLEFTIHEFMDNMFFQDILLCCAAKQSRFKLSSWKFLALSL